MLNLSLGHDVQAFTHSLPYRSLIYSYSIPSEVLKSSYAMLNEMLGAPLFIEPPPFVHHREQNMSQL